MLDFARISRRNRVSFAFSLELVQVRVATAPPKDPKPSAQTKIVLEAMEATHQKDADRWDEVMESLDLLFTRVTDMGTAQHQLNVNIFGSSVSRSVGFFIFFSLQVLQHILDLGKQEHGEGEKRDPRRHWSSIRPSPVRWCRSALGGDGQSSGRRKVAGDVEVDGGVARLGFRW